MICMPRIIATIPTGRFTKKMYCQENALVKNPPTTGPSAAPSIVNMATIPSACPRRDAARYDVTMTAPSAEITAPPTACTIREIIRMASVGESPQRSEPVVKRAKPPMNTLRYPFISPRREAASRRLTRIIRYALSTHDTATVDTSKAFAMSGRAMLTIVASSPAMNEPSATTSTISRSSGDIFDEEVEHSVILSFLCSDGYSPVLIIVSDCSSGKRAHFNPDLHQQKS